MHAATLRLPVIRPSSIFRLSASKNWPPSRSSLRVSRATQRQLPTRGAKREFLRYYAQLMARRQKIRYTLALARLRV